MTGPPQVGVRDDEDLSRTGLRPADQEELYAAAGQCVLAYTSSGTDWPAAVVMSFLRVDGELWLTAAGGRDHVESLRTDPRVTVVVDNRGTDLDGRRMVALRGTVALHTDRATKDWFYPAFAARHAPGDPDAFVRLLDSERRVVLHVVPTGSQKSHDSRRMAGDGRGGPAATTPSRPGDAR